MWMQDFIPPEELARMLSKSKSSTAKAQSEALEEASKIKEDNIGHKLLQKMGWKEGEGLGARGDGIAAPISATGSARDNLGLGAKVDHYPLAQSTCLFPLACKLRALGSLALCFIIQANQVQNAAECLMPDGRLRNSMPPAQRVLAVLNFHA